MAKLNYFLVATLAVATFLLLIPSKSEAAIAEYGKVKCILFLNLTDNLNEAHDVCRKKMQDELKEKNEKDEKKERIPYPYNATVEDFEWDDHCRKHCVYKTVGVLSDDDTLPKKTDTTKIFGKDKVSDDRYKLITSAWDDCLDLSGEIGKKKGWDNCKIVTHHDFCFEHKLVDIMFNLQVDC